MTIFLKKTYCLFLDDLKWKKNNVMTYETLVSGALSHIFAILFEDPSSLRVWKRICILFWNIVVETSMKEKLFLWKN